MGIGFTIDTPIKVARFGISSVISIVEDELIEQMRKFHCHQSAEEYVPIKFRDVLLRKQFIDFVVDEKIVVELKKKFHFSKANIDQVLYYMQEKKLKLALLINFGNEGVTFKRIVNEK